MPDIPLLYLALGAFAVVLLIYFLFIRDSNNHNSSRSSSIPRGSEALTRYLKNNYSRIENAKRKTRNSERISSETKSWLKSLGKQMLIYDIITKDLNVNEKFAAIFVVNELFHNGNRSAGNKKNFFQRTIILYHRNEVRLNLISYGSYSGTYEISCGIWSTHLPKAVVDGGALDRNIGSKPKVKQALSNKSTTFKKKSSSKSKFRW
jgi:hypothetical protein